MIDVLASDLLDSAVMALDAAGRPVPDRQAVTHGRPAWDCEQLTVAVVTIEPRSERSVAQTSAQRCALIAVATLELAVVRCVPTQQDDGQPPAADDVTASALGLAADAMVLWDMIVAGRLDGSLFPRVTGLSCDRVQPTVARTDGPTGGLAGWTLPVRLTLDVARPV